MCLSVGSKKKSTLFIHFIHLIYVCSTLAEIPRSVLKSSQNLPSAWAPTQAFKAQSAKVAAMDPLFPPVRPSQSSSQTCFPPPASAQNTILTSPIVTPSSMPPSRPLVHGPQALPGAPIEFPLLNEAQNSPIGQIHHISPATTGASTKNPDWLGVSVSPPRPTPSPLSTPSIPLQPGPKFTGELQVTDVLSLTIR